MRYCFGERVRCCPRVSLYIDVSVDVFDREQSTALEADLGEVVLGTADLMELKTRRKTVNVSSNTGGRRDEPVSLRRSEGVGRESKRNKKGRSMVAAERRRRRQALKPPASILKLRSGHRYICARECPLCFVEQILSSGFE